MIGSYIQKGEAVLVYSDTPYSERHMSVQKNFDTHPDVVVYAEEKLKMETVRDFIYEMQKASTGGIFGVEKIGILICDDIVLPAQHALLKALEDLHPATSIVIYAHSQSVFMSTVLSRVIQISDKEKGGGNNVLISGKTAAERLEAVKKIMKDFDDEKITKQDIISILEQVKGNAEVYSRAFSMLRQPSVSVKYVLEYVALQL